MRPEDKNLSTQHQRPGDAARPSATLDRTPPAPGETPVRAADDPEAEVQPTTDDADHR